MRYAADIADCGPHKGKWVVVDCRTGQLASGPFARRKDAESEAFWLNERVAS